MKRTFFAILAFAAAILLSVSCLKEVEVEVSSPYEKMIFEAEGATELVYVQYSNTLWNIDSDVTWLTVQRLNDKSFNVTCAPNITGSERKGTIIISATVDPLIHHDIKVTQKASQEAQMEPQQ